MDGLDYAIIFYGIMIFGLICNKITEIYFSHKVKKTELKLKQDPKVLHLDIINRGNSYKAVWTNYLGEELKSVDLNSKS